MRLVLKKNIMESENYEEERIKQLANIFYCCWTGRAEKVRRKGSIWKVEKGTWLRTDKVRNRKAEDGTWIINRKVKNSGIGKSHYWI